MFFFKRHSEAAREYYNSGELFRPILEIAKFGALDEKERAQTNLPDFLSEGLQVVAKYLVEGHSRCAFCEETRQDLFGHHFRPPLDSGPMESREDREFYFWLSLTEENIYPICPDCQPDDPSLFPLRSGARARPWPEMFKVAEMALNMDTPQSKNSNGPTIAEDVTRLFFDGASVSAEILPMDTADPEAVKQLSDTYGFDVAALGSVSDYSTRRAEQPLFYEPGQIRNPARYFAIDFSGAFSAREPADQTDTSSANRAEATLDHFKLNRPDIVKRRRSFLKEKRKLLEEAAEAGSADDFPDLFLFDEGSHSSALYLMLHRIATDWAESEGRTGRFSKRELPRTLANLIESGSPSNLRQVIDTIERAPEQTKATVAFADTALEDTAPPATTGQPVQRARPKINTVEHAKITSVEIRNFKALENLTLSLPQPPANTGKTDAVTAVPAIMMLGENACGKSTILEAISVAAIDSQAFEALELDTNKLVLNPRYMGLRHGAEGMEERMCEVNVTLETGTAYRTRFSRSEPVRREIRNEGEDWRPVGPEDGLNIFAYGAHRLFGAKTRNEGEAANVCTLFDNAKLLSDPEAWMIDLYDKDTEALDEIVAKLRNLISIDGDFRSIDVVPDPDNPNKRVCEIRVSKDLKDADGQTRKYDVHMPLSAVSSGYRTIIALFCDIISGLLAAAPPEEVNEALIKQALSTPCTVMIDEIEAHLHPRWKMQVVQGLREVLPNAYFILTSHDPLCIRGMESEEVFVLNRDLNPDSQSETDVLERVEFEPGKIKTELFTVEQLLTSNLFNLLTTEGYKRELFWARQIELGEGREQIDQEVADALPIGDNVVTRLVQDAVWAYLKKTRGQVHDLQARNEVISKIKDDLAKASF